MEKRTDEKYQLDEATNARIQLIDALEAIKEEYPELDSILQQFQINQEEYDKTMLSILSSQIEPRNTYATKETIYA